MNATYTLTAEWADLLGASQDARLAQGLTISEIQAAMQNAVASEARPFVLIAAPEIRPSSHIGYVIHHEFGDLYAETLPSGLITLLATLD